MCWGEWLGDGTGGRVWGHHQEVCAIAPGREDSLGEAWHTDADAERSRGTICRLGDRCIPQENRGTARSQGPLWVSGSRLNEASLTQPTGHGRGASWGKDWLGPFLFEGQRLLSIRQKGGFERKLWVIRHFFMEMTFFCYLHSQNGKQYCCE